MALFVENFLDDDLYQSFVKLAEKVDSETIQPCTKSNWVLYYNDKETFREVCINYDSQAKKQLTDSCHPTVDKHVQEQIFTLLERVGESTISFGGCSHVEFQYTEPQAMWKPHIHTEHRINVTVPILPEIATGTIFYSDAEEVECEWILNRAVIFTNELHSFRNDGDKKRFTVNIFCA